MSLAITKIAETSGTITLGWTPPAGIGGYVLYAKGQSVSVATARLKDNSLRKEAKFSKTNPGPPFQVSAICRSAQGVFTLEVGTYVPPLPPDPADTGTSAPTAPVVP